MRKILCFTIFLLLRFLILFFLVRPVSAQTRYRNYLVRRGDWLSKIAPRFGVSLPTLIRVNQIGNPNLIFIGQRLKIPVESVSFSPKTYTVRWGDTLFSIAQRFKVSLNYLVRLNKILNPNLVFAGQKLLLSGKPKPLLVSNREDFWVEVNLSQQKLYLWQGNKVVFSCLVSTGVARYPTPTGQFRVWGKFLYDDMSGGSRRRGDYYFLPKVPYVIYFYKSFALHGTYWHQNFGRRMSHGCINLSIPDSKYLYQRLKIGDLVVIHY